MPKIIVKKIMSDLEVAELESDYIDEDHFLIIDKDIDVYTDDGKILAKFRKNVIHKSLTNDACNAFRRASKPVHNNRGAAAGNLDENKIPFYVGVALDPGKFRTKFLNFNTGIVSKQNVSNGAPANIAGYFDKPDRNLGAGAPPCRMTAFTRDRVKEWNLAQGYINRCDQLYKELAPIHHEKQRNACQQTPQYAIGETAFSTLAINYSWRTGVHRDAGDFKEGMGNLTIVKDPENKNDYVGGYTGFPQYGIAFNVLEGDFLLMDVHQWHCNTKLKPVHDVIYGKWLEKKRINGWYFNRLAMVMYYREKMIRCK